MNKTLINLLCGFIPKKSWRKSIRKKYIKKVNCNIVLETKPIIIKSGMPEYLYNSLIRKENNYKINENFIEVAGI